jgi:hypothetical protein
MKVIVYGDFNCPYSYLASQRADRLIRGGMARVDWRAVEHDRELGLTGSPSEADRCAWEKELAEVAVLALPGEDAPATPPPVVSNTRAALPSQVIPAVIGPDQVVRSGIDGLCYLADLAGAASPRRRRPVGAETAPDAGRQPLAAARAA